MKKLFACFAVLATGTLTTACYDTGTPEDCVGLSCPGGFQWPHGGEVRAWYIELPSGGHITRFFGKFIESEGVAEPDLEDGPGNTRPIPEIGRCGRDINPIQGTNIVDIDVGPEMTFTVGPNETITVPRIRAEDNDGMPFVDPYNRSHDLIYYREDFNIRDNSFFNFEHTATLQQELPFEVRDRETGEFSTTDTLGGIYMPPAIQLLEPPPGVVDFTRGQDLNVEWTFEEPNSEIFMSSSIVIVPAPGSGLPITLCVVGNSGQFTIPADVIDALPADDGVMVVGLVANQAVVTSNGTILHKWGISCDLVPWVRGG